IVGHLRNIDSSLAQRVADGLGLASLPEAPEPASPVTDQPVSPPLQTIGKMKDTLEGRAVGILIADGSDAALITAVTKAATAAGATVKIVARKVGGATLSDRTQLAAHGQLAGTPSVVFDAVAVILSDASALALAKDGCAVDFVRDAFGHLKAIGADAGGLALLAAAGIEPDAGVVDVSDTKAFIAQAKTRQWDREPKVRDLA
ncbi:MAG: catalase HPII, partial [Polyangiaceae bacterium]